MQVCFYLLLVLHVAEGCTLKDNEQMVYITAHIGGSALLPCYCTDLHTAPERFTWNKANIKGNKWEEISSESGQQRNRLQLVNGHSPGNLSLLISHLTEEDGGEYLCEAKQKDGHIFVRLTVKGCVLQDDGQTNQITAYTGESVLLPCYCAELYTTPVRFSWLKANTNRNMWEEISSESGQYGNRVQLVNGHSPGNLSLLLSHLTEEDGGSYQCNVEGRDSTYIILTVEGCTLEDSGTTIAAHTGGSVLLPCYCTHLRAKPETFTWKKYNQSSSNWNRIPFESDRVQPGNLSLLVSHLTEEDGGDYWCDAIKSGFIYIRLIVGEPPQSLPFVPFALVTVIFLHIIVAVVYHTKRNKAPDPATVYYSTATED